MAADRRIDEPDVGAMIEPARESFDGNQVQL
jgi:hypothetical protein